MNNTGKLFIVLKWLGILLLQIIMTQVVNLIFSIIFPSTDQFVFSKPVFFIIILGLCYAAGASLVGWISIALGWLKIRQKYLNRIIGALTGAFVPLLIAILFYHPPEPGNPFFFISMLTAALGFFLPDLFTLGGSRQSA